MKNYFKIAAKLLIKSAAKQHGVEPKIVVQLFLLSAKTEGSNISVFTNLMCMCLTPRLSEVLEWITDTTRDLSIPEATLSQLQTDQYRFLYHTIDNFYVRKVQEFVGLSFYPRLEDLFAPKEETSTATMLQALVRPTPIPD